MLMFYGSTTFNYRALPIIFEVHTLNMEFHKSIYGTPLFILIINAHRSFIERIFLFINFYYRTPKFASNQTHIIDLSTVTMQLLITISGYLELHNSIAVGPYLRIIVFQLCYRVVDLQHCVMELHKSVKGVHQSIMMYSYQARCFK